MPFLKEHQIQKENGVYDKRNQINDLTGKEWLFSTRSVKTKNYSFYFDIKKILTAGFIDFMPIELISELITTFSKSGANIIDPICNFGSIGYATSLVNEKRVFHGYGYIENSNVNFSKPFKNKHTFFSSRYVEKEFNLRDKEEKVLLMTELIFTSLKSKLRQIQLLEFEKILKNSLFNLLNKDLDINYIIISIQNTKDYDNYIYNTKNIFDIVTSYNYVLKSELIWKIFETEFLRIKDYLEWKNPGSKENNLLLNDKRILIFKKEL